MNEEYQQLHAYLQEQGMTTLSAEDWYAKYSQPSEYEGFYNAIADPNRDEQEVPLSTSLSKEDFYLKYFGQEYQASETYVQPEPKKKEEAEPLLSPLDQTEPSSELPSVSEAVSGVGDGVQPLYERSDRVTRGRVDLDTAVFDRARYQIDENYLDRYMPALQPGGADVITEGLKSPQGFFSLAELSGVDVFMGVKSWANLPRVEDQEKLNSAMEQIVFGNMSAAQGFEVLSDLAIENPSMLETMGIDRMRHITPGEVRQQQADRKRKQRQNNPDLRVGDSSLSGGDPISTNVPKTADELRPEIGRYLQDNLYEKLSEQYIQLLPQEYKEDEAYQESLEQYLLEEYGGMVDINQDGVVGSVPFLQFDGFAAIQGMGPVYPRWSGYLIDQLYASGNDLVAAWALLTGDEKQRKEALAKAQEYRSTTRQYTNTMMENLDEGEFQRAAEQAMGVFMEAAPTMGILIPSAVALSYTGAGPYWVTALTALEGATMSTSIQMAQLWDHPAFRTYKNTETDEVVTFDEYQRAIELNPSNESLFSSEVNVNARNGFASKAFMSNFLVDGVTSLAFVRGLKAVKPSSLTGAGMQWWKYHLAASGVSIPQGSLISSMVAMQQFIDVAELEGRTPSWAEIREVGVEAAVKGGLVTTAVGGAGALTGIALSRDQFGRGGRNLEFFQQELRLRKELLREDVSEAYKLRMENELYNLYNTPNHSRLLADEQFYAGMEKYAPQDYQLIRGISLEQTDMLRTARGMKAGDELNKLFADFEALSQKRLKLEELHEVRMREMADDMDPLSITIRDVDVPVTNQVRDIPLYPLVPRPYARWYEEAKTSNLTLDRILMNRWRFEEDAKTGSRPGSDVDAPVWNKLLEPQQADRLKRLNEDYTTLFKDMKELTPLLTDDIYALLPEGVEKTPAGFWSYFMEAIGAQERNALIYNKQATQDRIRVLKGKKKPTFEELMELDRLQSRRGSGMSDEEAAAFIKEMPDDILKSDVLGRIRQQFDRSADMMVEFGFWSEETRQYMRQQMPNYVTLFGSAADEIDPTTGVARDGAGMYPNAPKSFAQRFPISEAKGREDITVDAFGRMVQQQESLIVLGLKNQAMHKYWEFFNDYPEPFYYRTFTDETYAQAKLSEELPPLMDKNGVIADNVIQTFKDGKPHYLMFLDHLAAKRPMDRFLNWSDARIEKRGGIGLFGRGVNTDDPSQMVVHGSRLVESILARTDKSDNLFLRYLNVFGEQSSKIRQTFTSYNPFFPLVNGPKDMLTATWNAVSMTKKRQGYGLMDVDGNMISTNEFLKNFYTNVPRSMWASGRYEFNSAGLFKDLKSPNESRLHHKYFNEARKFGMITGYGYMDDLIKIQKQIRSQTDPKLRDKGIEITSRLNVLKMFEALNNTAENGVRFSAYYTLREMNVAPERAAAFARDLTVDFNRKGRSTSALSKYYWFFNPSAEGLDNFYRNTFYKTPELAPDGTPQKNPRRFTRNMVLAGVGLGVLMAEWNQMFGDVDESGIPYYDQLDRHILDRNFVFMLPGTGGDYLKFPKAYGVGFLPDMGRELSHFLHGKQGVGEMASNAFGSAAHNFSPVMIGEHAVAENAAMPESTDFYDVVGDVALPSFYQPIFDVQTNKMFDGRPIEPQYVKDKSPAYRSFMSPELVREHFQMWNDSTGGSEFRQGDRSYNPDKLWYPLRTYLGGLYTGTEHILDYTYGDRLTDEVGRVGVAEEAAFFEKLVEGGKFYYDEDEQKYVSDSDRDQNDLGRYEYEEDELRNKAEFLTTLRDTPNRLIGPSKTPILKYFYGESYYNSISQRYWETYERLSNIGDEAVDFTRWEEIGNMAPPQRDRVDGQIFREEGDTWRDDAYLMAGLVQQQINMLTGGGTPELRRDFSSITNVGMGTVRRDLLDQIYEIGDSYTLSDEQRKKKFDLQMRLQMYDQELAQLQAAYLRYADQYLKPQP